MKSPFAQYLSMLTSIVLLFWATMAKAEPGRHLAVLPPDVPHAAQGARAIAKADTKSRLIGCFYKDHKTNEMVYALQMGDAFAHYSVKGTTGPLPQSGRTFRDNRGVVVTKSNYEDGLTQLTSYDNGKVAVNLAGVPIGGKLVAKFFPPGFVMDELKVDGEASRGTLSINKFTGAYRCTKNCKFGKYPIASTEPDSDVVLDYDTELSAFAIPTRVRVTMKFGDMNLNGVARLTAKNETSFLSDSIVTDYLSTKACFNVDVTKDDGSPLELAKFGKPGTKDDEQVRHFLAWLEMMSHDLLAH